MNMVTFFDFETALKQLQSGQALAGENVIFTLLIKQLTTEVVLENYIVRNLQMG